MFEITFLLTIIDLLAIHLSDNLVPQKFQDSVEFWHTTKIPWNPLMVVNMLGSNLLFEWSCWAGHYDEAHSSWWQLALCFPVTSVLFYYVHRLLHHPRLYAIVHHVHHEFENPQAKVVYHAHPVEQLCLNILPVYLPMVLFRLCQSDAAVYVIVAHFSGFLAHTNWYDRSSL